MALRPVRIAVALAVGLVALVVAAPAGSASSATTASVWEPGPNHPDPAVRIFGLAVDNDVTVRVHRHRVGVTEAGPRIRGYNGCTAEDRHAVTCGVSAGAVYAMLGPGSDVIRISGAGDWKAVVRCGRGKDTVIARASTGPMTKGCETVRVHALRRVRS